MNNSCVSFENYPAIVTKFKNPLDQSARVLLAVTLPSGAENVTVDIVDDGDAVTIAFDWCKELYKPELLFATELRAL